MSIHSRVAKEGCFSAGGVLDSGRDGSLQGPLSQDSDGGQAAPLASQDGGHNRSDSSGNSAGSGNTGDVPSAGNSYAFASAGAAPGSGNGNGSRSESEFLSMNGGPLPPIAEHVTHSEMNSESTHSSMGDGSRMGGGSTAGISPRLPTSARHNIGSTLNPNVRPGGAVGDAAAADSSLMEPSTTISNSSQIGDSSVIISSAAAGAAGVTAAAVGMAALAPQAEAEEPETFHTLQDSVNSTGAYQQSDGHGEALLRPTSDQMQSMPGSVSAAPSPAGDMSDATTGSTASNPPTFGASSYPKLVPTATGPGVRAEGESGALEHSLGHVTSLGSMGIGTTGAMPTSQASSTDQVCYLMLYALFL